MLSKISAEILEIIPQIFENIALFLAASAHEARPQKKRHELDLLFSNKKAETKFCPRFFTYNCRLFTTFFISILKLQTIHWLDLGLYRKF